MNRIKIKSYSNTVIIESYFLYNDKTNKHYNRIYNISMN